MTSRDVSDEQLGRLAIKQNELFQRVKKGSIPVEVALEELQEIIGKKRGKRIEHVEVPVAHIAPPAPGKSIHDLGHRWIERHEWTLYKSQGGKVMDVDGKPCEVLIWNPLHSGLRIEDAFRHFAQLESSGSVDRNFTYRRGLLGYCVEAWRNFNAFVVFREVV